MDNLKIRAVSAPWHNGVELLVMDGNSRIKDIIFEKMEEGLMVDPTFRIDNKTAQTLIDDLWAAGLRPTDGTGSAGQLRATEKHLADMQQIAFHKLGIGKK